MSVEHTCSGCENTIKKDECYCIDCLDDAAQEGFDKGVEDSEANIEEE